MAPLAALHWETVTPAMRETLRFIGTCPFATRFYLAGGTALALRLGHRRSVDLDFFSESDEVGADTRREILRALAPLTPRALESTEGNLLLELRGMHVGFFGYAYPLLEPPDWVEGIAVASLADIGLMKLDALISRGSRKDFYDLYAVAQQIPLGELLTLGAVKYAYARDFALMAVEAMVLFDNADRDLQPEIFVGPPWEQVKAFFIAQARALGEAWFGA